MKITQTESSAKTVGATSEAEISTIEIVGGAGEIAEFYANMENMERPTPIVDGLELMAERAVGKAPELAYPYGSELAERQLSDHIDAVLREKGFRPIAPGVYLKKFGPTYHEAGPDGALGAKQNRPWWDGGPGYPLYKFVLDFFQAKYHLTHDRADALATEFMNAWVSEEERKPA